MASIEDFKQWIDRDFRRFAPIETHVQNIEPPDRVSRGPQQAMSVRVFTDTNQYTIHAIERPDGTGYLGCTSSCRKPRAGETWTRGRDLHDGPLTERDWFRILADIVSYELVRFHDPAEAMRRAAVPASGPNLSLAPAEQSDPVI